MQTACAGKCIPPAGKKKPPGFSPGGSHQAEKSSCLTEAQPRTQTDDARADDLTDELRVRLLQPLLALQNVRLVEHVEHVGTDGQAEVAERELLLEAGVDDVDVVV